MQQGSRVEYSEPSQTSKMELFAKIGNGFQPLTVFGKALSWMLYLVLNMGSVCRGLKNQRKKILRKDKENQGTFFVVCRNLCFPDKARKSFKFLECLESFTCVKP